MCVSRNEDWYSLSLQEHPTLVADRNYNDLGWSLRERNNPLLSSQFFLPGLWRSVVVESVWGDLGEFSNLLGGFRLKRWTHYCWFMTESNFWNCLLAGLSLAAVLLPNCKLGQVRQRYESLDLAGGLLVGPCAGGLLTKYQSRCWYRLSDPPSRQAGQSNHYLTWLLDKFSS